MTETTDLATQVFDRALTAVGDALIPSLKDKLRELIDARQIFSAKVVTKAISDSVTEGGARDD